MSKNIRRVLAVTAVSLWAAAPVLLAGCSSDTKLSAEEAANIKGKGEMSPEAQAHIAEAMKKAQERMKQSGKGPGGGAGGPGAPGGPPPGAPPGPPSAGKQ